MASSKAIRRHRAKNWILDFLQPGQRGDAARICLCLPPVHLHRKLGARDQSDAAIFVGNGMQAFQVIGDWAGSVAKKVDLSAGVNCRDARGAVTEFAQGWAG